MKDQGNEMSKPRKTNGRDGQDTNGVNVSRRSLTKAGLAAPALVTLVSRPVFGAQCLSQMLSGNLSHHGDGNCVLGWSPGGWKNPVGKVAGFDTVVIDSDGTELPVGSGGEDSAWYKATGLDLAYSDGTKPESTGERCSRYDGGNATFGLIDGTSTTPLRAVLCDESDQFARHLAAAYLNALLSRNELGAFGGQYVLTVAQVIDMYENPSNYGGVGAVIDLLDATWN